MDEQRIEAAAEAMYDAVLAGAGTADDFNSRPPEVRAIWLSAARAASPHLAQDEGLRKAAQDVVHAWEHKHCDDADINALKAALAAPLPEGEPREHPCDYRNTDCTNTGVTIEGKWYCVKHLPPQPPAPAPDEGVTHA